MLLPLKKTISSPEPKIDKPAENEPVFSRFVVIGSIVPLNAEGLFSNTSVHLYVLHEAHFRWSD